MINKRKILIKVYNLNNRQSGEIYLTEPACLFTFIQPYIYSIYTINYKNETDKLIKIDDSTEINSVLQKYGRLRVIYSEGDTHYGYRNYPTFICIEFTGSIEISYM